MGKKLPNSFQFTAVVVKDDGSGSNQPIIKEFAEPATGGHGVKTKLLKNQRLFLLLFFLDELNLSVPSLLRMFFCLW